MKIIIPTIGTRGDIQPYIALALGLQKAGHTVTLATHPCMRGLVESYKVIFAPIGPDIDIGHEAAMIRAKAAQLGVGPKPIARSKLTIENMAEALVQMPSPEIQDKACALGASIRAEPDGITEAVRLIEETATRVSTAYPRL